MRPQVGAEFERLAARLHEHGATSDRLESRRAFAEKRAPEWKGWNDPEDRFRTPKLDDGKNGRGPDSDQVTAPFSYGIRSIG